MTTGTRFSRLAQITPANVGKLVRAWEFHTGDVESRPPAAMARTKFEATPTMTCRRSRLWRIETGDGQRDVVIQPTKQGFVFVLDRDTGKPVWPVEERAVPQGGAEGELLWPTP